MDAALEPTVEVLEPPVAHSDLAAVVALPVTDQHRPANRVDVGLAERERFGDPQAPAPEHRDYRSDAEAVAVLAGLAHDGMISSTRGGSAG